MSASDAEAGVADRQGQRGLSPRSEAIAGIRRALALGAAWPFVRQQDEFGWMADDPAFLALGGTKKSRPAHGASSALVGTCPPAERSLGVADDDDVGIERSQLPGCVGEADLIAPDGRGMSVPSPPARSTASACASEIGGMAPKFPLLRLFAFSEMVSTWPAPSPARDPQDFARHARGFSTRRGVIDPGVAEPSRVDHQRVPAVFSRPSAIRR